MMRLDKYLAERTGMTRSESRKAVTKGRVMVGGMVCRKADTQLDEHTAEVALDGTPLAPGTGYTYNAATGAFATTAGTITVPAAAAAQLAARAAAPCRLPVGDGAAGRRRAGRVLAGRVLADAQRSLPALPDHSR